MPSPPSSAMPPRAPTTGARLTAESREGAVRERFVRELAARVPVERVAEVHLFAPMRQGGVESGVAVVAVRPEPATDAEDAGETPRHTVYTATYRLTVRGPDRGRWQVDVREEADAPLVTVEAVVRGVQRRAGDAHAPARLDPETLARVVNAARDAAGPSAGGLG